MGSVYSVSQVNSYIKHMFSEDFALNNISIKGEVSNCKYHSSGHIYFTLKEENSVLSCVMFASQRVGLKFQLKEGQKVIANGYVNVYERDGKYQLYVKEVSLDGEGDLFKKYEQLKKELMEMGMFDKAYKKPIPKYATRIGIVTASTGAAIQDIVNISKRRNPHVSLFLFSAIVQGPEAKMSIVEGINELDKMGLDVIIVGRGGGSIEDLWAFNEEEVARAIFSSSTPVISAVGHETDTTIADYVADLRAPTPSAAAELAVFDYYDFLQDLENIRYTLYKELKNNFDNKKLILSELSLKLAKKSPENQIKLRRQQLDEMSDKLLYIMKRRLEDSRHKLMIMAERLDGLSPLKKLQSGFSYVSKAGKVVKHIDDIKTDDIIDVNIVDGKFSAKVIDVKGIDD